MDKTIRHLVTAATGALVLGLTALAPAHAAPAAQEPVEHGYALEGSSHIAKPDGTTSLNGRVDMTLDSSTGALTADLALEPTLVRFTLLGAVPVRADLVFEPAGPTTGTLHDGMLTTETRTIVKMPRVRMLGVPVGGGDTCRTVTPTYIKLTSEGTFDLAAGGVLKGHYTLPKFEGCGRYSDLISGFASGPGNGVDVTLTPAQG